MRLNEAKQLFFKLRAENRIDVCEWHVIEDHPERGYTIDEVLSLVKAAGSIRDTTDMNFLGKRFYWRTSDVEGNRVRLVVEFDKDDHGQLILVISAGEMEKS